MFVRLVGTSAANAEWWFRYNRTILYARTKIDDASARARLMFSEKSEREREERIFFLITFRFLPLLFGVHGGELHCIEILFICWLRQIRSAYSACMRINDATSRGRASLYFVQLHLNSSQYFCAANRQWAKQWAIRQWPRKHNLISNAHCTQLTKAKYGRQFTYLTFSGKQRLPSNSSRFVRKDLSRSTLWIRTSQRRYPRKTSISDKIAKMEMIEIYLAHLLYLFAEAIVTTEWIASTN